jgi:futalosine hydrolase
MQPMHLLVVAATEGELASLDIGLTQGRCHIEVMITGVGMVATAAHVSRALARTRFDLAINIGVCGAFDRALALAGVVHVTSDRIPELGVEDGQTFVPADAIGLVDAGTAPFTGGCLVNAAPPVSASLAALPQVSGITVNTAHGDAASIAAVVDRCHPQVESMEGAAFMYACLIAGTPFAQIRAVSNYVERRNQAAWALPEAIAALGRTATAVIGEVSAR